ncbi:hypothetical protein BJV82DRAFT_627362 [Fennellomyces sp. T-0311]|nr:hypothetical protein BJV82DRAFT_627362 [Fennellomyces sp. T-0311]
MATYEKPMIRLEQFKTQHELARNFYDDYDFCPLLCSDEVIEHRQRVQQRISPQSSPSTSPSAGSHTRAIPIIDPSNMTPVSVPNKLASWPALARASEHRINRAISIVDPVSGHPIIHQSLQPSFGYYDVSVR